MFANTKSLSQYTCAQIFCMDFNSVAFYPMHHKANAHLALEQSIFDYGVFNTLIPYNAPELVSREFWLQYKPVEAYTPNQNKAEAMIRELNRSYRRAMRKSHALQFCGTISCNSWQKYEDTPHSTYSPLKVRHHTQFLLAKHQTSPIWLNLNGISLCGTRILDKKAINWEGC